MKQRQGSVTLEAILVIPILVIASVALVQFFITAIVHQAAVSAATEGARTASMAGSDIDDVRNAVDKVLRSVNLGVGDKVRLVCQTPISTESRGSFAVTPPSNPPLDSNEVRVVVCIDMTANPLLNSLAAFGIDTGGKRMMLSSQRFRE